MFILLQCRSDVPYISTLTRNYLMIRLCLINACRAGNLEHLTVKDFEETKFINRNGEMYGYCTVSISLYYII